MVFTEQQLERALSRAARLRHELETDRRLLDRAGPAGAIDLPPPRLRRLGAVLHDDGKVEVIEHVRKDGFHDGQPGGFQV